jgi:hypothetical protein
MALIRIVTTALVLTLTASVAYAQTGGETLSLLQTAVACAPPPAFGAMPLGLPRIVGGQDTEARTLFGVRDLVVVGGPAASTLQVGQRYFVRRPMPQRPGANGNVPIAETLGWVRAVATSEGTVIAMVEVACESMSAGDHLEPFAVPQVPAGADRVDTTGAPDFNMAGQVIFGRDRRRTGSAGDFMLIDHGSSDGVAAGMRMAIYRDVTPDTPLATIGEAIVISTAETTALIRITQARAAVETGDYVVPRR